MKQQVNCAEVVRVQKWAFFKYKANAIWASLRRKSYKIYMISHWHPRASNEMRFVGPRNSFVPVSDLQQMLLCAADVGSPRLLAKHFKVLKNFHLTNDQRSALSQQWKSTSRRVLTDYKATSFTGAFQLQFFMPTGFYGSWDPCCAFQRH